MKKYYAYLLIALLMLGCRAESAGPVFVTTINPIAQIIGEVAGTRAEVVCLMPPAASPHTFSPDPSDVRKAGAAHALFYVSENADGWAAKLPSEKKYKLLDMLPEKHRMRFSETIPGFPDSTAIDPHFWTDPLTVKALVPIIADTLAKLDPENASSYRTNADLFIKRLNLLDRQVESILRDIKGKHVFLFHPSFLYLMNRYGLKYGGAIEPFPGKEPTPRTIVRLSKKIKSLGVKAIFSEPQLPDSPADVVADEAGVFVYELDPIGAKKQLRSYSEIILYNARTLKIALQ